MVSMSWKSYHLSDTSRFLCVYVCDTLHRTTLLPFANTRGTLQMNQRFPFRLDTKNFSQKSPFQLGMLVDIANLSIKEADGERFAGLRSAWAT